MTSSEEDPFCGLPYELCECRRQDFDLDPELTSNGLWCIITGVSTDGIGTVASVHQDFDCALAERVYGQELRLRFDSPAVGDQVCCV